MKNSGMQLIWIVVSDFQQSLMFYTETLGFTLHEKNDQYGWAELSGPSGYRLGIAKFSGKTGEPKPGSNAVVTITVDDINKGCQDLKTRNVNMLGDIIEVPGQVKMQTFSDKDGNLFQLCELLKK